MTVSSGSLEAGLVGAGGEDVVDEEEEQEGEGVSRRRLLLFSNTGLKEK